MQAEGVLERDTNLLAQAQMDLERYRTAWARNGINKQLLDDQEKIVLQDQGTVKNDQGTVNYDQVQLGYCHITAPISGRVGLRLVDPGNVVQAGGSDRAGGDYPGAADYRDLHHCRRQPGQVQERMTQDALRCPWRPGIADRPSGLQRAS